MLNESKIIKDALISALNESVSDKPQKNERPAGATEWTFADWFGRDLTGETYEGSIDCDNCYSADAKRKITSLKGAPKIVTGDFNCSNNHLTSLEFGPEKVGRNFDCGYNKLTSLKFAPKEVGRNFICMYNQLTSLEFAPEKVGGNFNCKSNQLTSLEGAPKEVGGDFICIWNKFRTLEGCPERIGGDFESTNVGLTSLKGGPKEVGGDFECDLNHLTTLEGGPEKVGGSYSVYQNKLITLKGAPQKIKKSFCCKHSNLTSLEFAPKEVGGNFDCSFNKLVTLKGCPERIGGDLICMYNQLTSFEGAPKGIGGTLNAIRNQFTSYKDAPEKYVRACRSSVEIASGSNYSIEASYDHGDYSAEYGVINSTLAKTLVKKYRGNDDAEYDDEDEDGDRNANCAKYDNKDGIAIACNEDAGSVLYLKPTKKPVTMKTMNDLRKIEEDTTDSYCDVIPWDCDGSKTPSVKISNEPLAKGHNYELVGLYADTDARTGYETPISYGVMSYETAVKFIATINEDGETFEKTQDPKYGGCITLRDNEDASCASILSRTSLPVTLKTVKACFDMANKEKGNLHCLPGY